MIEAYLSVKIFVIFNSIFCIDFDTRNKKLNIGIKSMRSHNQSRTSETYIDAHPM